MKKVYGIGMAVLLASCGGGGGSDSASDGEALTGDQETQAGSISQNLASGLSSGASLSVSKSLYKTEDFSFDCSGGGTISIEEDSINYNTCIFGDDGSTVTTDGSLSFTEVDADTMTLTYDLTSSVTGSEGSHDSSLEGTMTLDTSGEGSEVTLAISGTYDANTFAVTGEMAVSADSIFTEDICIEDSTAGVDFHCVITESDNINISTATVDDFANACTVGSCS